MSKVLIIEDEEAIAELEKDYLELSGFDVEIENDGLSGLTKALEKDFDMYILDLMLPGVDGFEICKKIREEKNTPILMVSAKKDDIDKIRGLGLGADDPALTRKPSAHWYRSTARIPDAAFCKSDWQKKLPLWFTAVRTTRWQWRLPISSSERPPRKV